MPTVPFRTSTAKRPKNFKLPSMEFEITAEDAAHMLVRDQEDKQRIKEIKANKQLFNAASEIIRNKLVAQREAELAATRAAAKKT